MNSILRFQRDAILLAALLAVAGCTTSEGLPGDRVSAYAVARTQNGMAIVQRGDTLYSMAQRYNVPMSELMAENHISPNDTLRDGELLKLPADATPPEMAADLAPPAEMSVTSDNTGLAATAAPVDTSVTAQPLESEPKYVLTPMGPSGQPAAQPGAATQPAPAPAVAGVTAASAAQAGGTQTGTAQTGVASTTGAAGTSDASSGGAAQTTAATGATGAGAAAADSAASTQGATDAASDVSFRWPVTGRVLSGFGKKADGSNNEGIDIQSPRGTSVTAAAPGVVLYTGDSLKDFGNLVLIRHEGGWITAYAHLDHVLVAKDAVVAAGDPVGTVGTSGGLTVPQLHFEIRKGDTPVDPRKLLEQSGGGD